jgi:hypothetical protein
MAFVEGIQHAEDEEHTEVGIRSSWCNNRRGANQAVSARGQPVRAGVGRHREHLFIPRHTEVQARIQFLIRPGARRCRRVRARHGGLGGLRSTSEDEGNQSGDRAFGPGSPSGAVGGGGGDWCSIGS